MTSRRLVVSLALGSVLALALTSVALATHARPGAGSPLRVPLVPAYNQCNPPGNSTHVAPIALPSCNPPVLNSDIVTVGTTGLGSGFIKLSVFCQAPEVTPPCTFGDGQEEEDIQVDTFASDVRCQKVAPGCTAAGADFTGQLFGSSPIRITDHSNGSPVGVTCADAAGNPPCVTATTINSDFEVPMAAGSCVATGGAAGANCNFSTTINTAVPGAVKERQRGVVSVFGLKVFDFGEDGSAGATCAPICGTGDETIFLDQGLFLP
jgi:hypothetical protein